MKKNKIDLSLIVPTIGRVNDLKRLMESLIIQTNQNFELIIADQSGTPDEISRLISQYLQVLRIKHLPLNNLGASRARNAGLSLAEGRIVGWPDDDCWYEQDVVNEVVCNFNTTNNPIMVIGRPLTETGEPYNRWLPQKLKIINVMDSLNFGIEWVVFMEKASIYRFGGFDENFGPGSNSPWGAGESSDLCLRVLNSEKEILFCPNIRIYHPISKIDSNESRKKASSYAYAMGAVIRKNSLSFININLYIWTYIRAIIWAFLHLNMKNANYHYLRLGSVINGYHFYEKDLYSLKKDN